jgi:hypothetical protein
VLKAVGDLAARLSLVEPSVSQAGLLYSVQVVGVEEAP